MKYYIVDLETSVKNRGSSAIGNMLASPYCANNDIVLIGERHAGKSTTRSVGHALPQCLVTAKKEATLVVGHNVIFDVKYLKSTYPETYKEAVSNLYVWDTMQVAYILSGQTDMYPSLDDLCKELGLELKDEAIKRYWDDGVDTEDIPADELKEYLLHDLDVTERIFRYQYEMVKDNVPLFNLIKAKMDDLLATMEMEDNGMSFNLVEAHRFATANDETLRDYDKFFKGVPFINTLDFNPLSGDHVSLALFGGDYKTKIVTPILNPDGTQAVFKTGARKGQVKHKQEETILKYAGMLNPASHGLVATKANGKYSVDEEVLNTILKDLQRVSTSGMEEMTNVLAIAFIKSVLRYRELTKENETYYRGYSKLVWPDGMIHGSIGHCGTRTGRNNHTKPNLGNVSRD